MADAVTRGNLPFEEANDFLRRKVNVPTKSWTDLWEKMHARAFSVSGATTTELLDDFRKAVEKAQLEGASLETFRKDFDQIVKKHGWSYKGSRGWRTQVIYSTNLRVAHAAGRYQQMKAPEVVARRPFWMYRHGDSVNPRPLHKSWDGLTLPHNDPWWDTHYPPNGWGCSCKVFAVGDRELKRQGKDAPDTAPNDGVEKKVVAGKTVTVPAGIDPGWAYNVGAAAAQGNTEDVQ